MGVVHGAAPVLVTEQQGPAGGETSIVSAARGVLSVERVAFFGRNNLPPVCKGVLHEMGARSKQTIGASNSGVDSGTCNINIYYDHF